MLHLSPPLGRGSGGGAGVAGRGWRCRLPRLWQRRGLLVRERRNVGGLLVLRRVRSAFGSRVVSRALHLRRKQTVGITKSLPQFAS